MPIDIIKLNIQTNFQLTFLKFRTNIQRLQKTPTITIKIFASDIDIINNRNGIANIDPAKPVIVCTIFVRKIIKKMISKSLILII